MTVAELIAELQKIDPSLPVKVCLEGGALEDVRSVAVGATSNRVLWARIRTDADPDDLR